MRGIVGWASALAALLLAAGPVSAEPARGWDRPPEDEIVYFVLPDRFENGDPSNDRGGLRGGRLVTGFDPTHKGFYHGGDLAGLTARLDYIAGMGATAVWVGPVFKNKPVQGPPGWETAGYHGYWITDFTDVDPHFGTRAEFKAFVDAAHARGLKVYMDIITNHTADVIQYRNCPGDGGCPYRSRAAYPYQRQGGPDGPAINPGFLGDAPEHQTTENFARLVNPNYAYEVVVPRAERKIKKPDWLNDPIYYHNRGETTFRGENSRLGDFAGLDDLYTEHPRVVAGMIEIYGAWIDDFGVDGFRIDTARHVNPEFWTAFVPAMLERAKRRGIEHFHIFGEVYDPDPGRLARFTHVDGFPSVLDFAFQAAALDVLGKGAPTERLAHLFEADAVYAGGPATALQLPTFLGNHDMGRFAHLIQRQNPTMPESELLARVRLGHALMMFTRGVPVIYYGDEQGMIGDGHDQDARETMFPSRVASYLDNDLLATDATNADAKFNPNAALYRDIAALAAIRSAHPVLRRGAQVTRAYGDGPGVFAFSRLLDGEEALVAINTTNQPISTLVEVGPLSENWRALLGACPAKSAAPGTLALELAPLGAVVCLSGPAP